MLHMLAKPVLLVTVMPPRRLKQPARPTKILSVLENLFGVCLSPSGHVSALIMRVTDPRIHRLRVRVRRVSFLVYPSLPRKYWNFEEVHGSSAHNKKVRTEVLQKSGAFYLQSQGPSPRHIVHSAVVNSAVQVVVETEVRNHPFISLPPPPNSVALSASANQKDTDTASLQKIF